MTSAEQTLHPFFRGVILLFALVAIVLDTASAQSSESSFGRNQGAQQQKPPPPPPPPPPPTVSTTTTTTLARVPQQSGSPEGNYDELNERCHRGEALKLDAKVQIAACYELIKSPQVQSAGRATTYFKIATIMIESTKDYNEAIRLYDLALKEDPKRAIALDGKAAAFVALKRCDEAIEIYNQSMAIKPDSASLKFGIGQAQLCKGQYQEAVKYLEEAATISPHVEMNHLYAGYTYALLGETKLAVNAIDAASRLNAEGVWHRFNAALVAYVADDLAGAKKRLEEFEKTTPNTTYGALLGYLIGLREGKDDKTALTKAYERTKDDVITYDPLLLKHFLGMAGSEPIAKFIEDSGDKETEKGSRRSEAHFYVGELALIKGDIAKAQREFEVATERGAQNITEYWSALARREQMKRPKKAVKNSH